ncbi:phosphoglycerate kinase [Candidatus Riesia pediculicola]|uniref:phosphoglycerate kinase n=1 Tax=Candidatus Riesia pediculicola TaxID=401619 RepID=UPI0009C26B7E|nr:phosphoglycerate kinase [Candidatus Riesia pediculicola]ARC54185.1 phosphoglycerate kinase [Candidatus Riesia pediculicola]
MIHIKSVNIDKKKVLIRCDFNVPIKSSKIISDYRITSSIPTIEYALRKRSKVILMSHLGRPVEGIYEDRFSLRPISNFLSKILNFPVNLVQNYLQDEDIVYENDEILMLENVRFNKGETNNDPFLSQKYAKLCDVFVMDAFGVSHRKESSSYGIAEYSPISCAGILFSKEIDSLSKILEKPISPLVTIIGGSKISSKLAVIKELSKISDKIILGGGVANTIISSSGLKVGRSLVEKKLIPESKMLLKNSKVFFPIDVKVSKKISHAEECFNKSVQSIEDDDYIVDLGEQTIKRISQIVKNSKMIIWSGPLGIFEIPNFSLGTKRLIEAISKSEAYSLAGGGDTVSAIEKFDSFDKISYVSTGGGAFLKYIETREIPIVSKFKG